MFRHLIIAVILLSGWASAAAEDSLPGPEDDWPGFGPLFDASSLTLSLGLREEAAGPVYYHQEEDGEETTAMPPLWSHWTDSITDAEELDILYPISSYDRFGSQYRFHIGQMIAFAGGETIAGGRVDRFTIFPFYFQQRGTDPENHYTAVFPLVGRLKNRLFRSEVEWVLWPIYSKTVRKGMETPSEPDVGFKPGRYFVRARRGDVTTFNYLIPFFHYRTGPSLQGWQFWPLVGNESKQSHSFTNAWGDVAVSPGHQKFFALWPLYFREDTFLETENAQKLRLVLPFYGSVRSPGRDWTSYGWPLGYMIADDRARKYREVGAPWPFIGFARGEGKYMDRVWPLFSIATNATLQSRSFLWPLYTDRRVTAPPLDRRRTRAFFFLYSDLTERNTATGATRRRTDFWPLFTAQRSPEGHERLQLLAVLEPILPTSKSIVRNYSPLWSIWRQEKNGTNGATSQSFLWNLYRNDTTAEARKCSILFGLFQYQSSAEGRRWRLFYIPLGGKHNVKAGKPAS